MAFSDNTPNIGTVAKLNVEMLINLDMPGAVGEKNRLLDRYGPGFRGSDTTVARSTFPVTYRYASSADTLLVWLSGSRTVRGMQQLASSMISPGASMRDIRDNPQCADWAAELARELVARGLGNLPKWCIAGHSMGGAIGLSLAFRETTITTPPRIYCSSFGSPATWGLGGAPPNNMWYARWTNPADNVPSLPPGELRAPNLYATLTRIQRYNVSQWRHPQRAYDVDTNGVVALQDSPDSTPIGVRTILAALQSENGVFGAGHPLEVYLANITRYAESTTGPPEPPPPPVVTGGAAPAPSVPIRMSPPTPAPPPRDAPLDARRTAFAAAAMVADNPSFVVDTRFAPSAVRFEKVWVVYWMDFQLCVAPTKKKARAIVRHLKAFLKVFQGAGEVDVYACVFAWSSYLNAASTPGNNFYPVMNNGGNFFGEFLED